MTLRLVQIGNSLPISYPVDPSAEFQSGMIGQLGVFGNNIVCGVSDGTAPLGIIDDEKTRAFTNPSIDEVVIVSVPEVARKKINGRVYTSIDIPTSLRNPNVLKSTFMTNPVDCALVPRNGMIIFVEGTELNFDLDNDGEPDSIRTVVSYTYQVPNIPGDDSTAGTGSVTIWFSRIIAQTDMFETNQRYVVNQNLFVSECGLLTSRRVSPDHPCVAMVTGPPSALHGSLEFMWI